MRLGGWLTGIPHEVRRHVPIAPGGCTGTGLSPDELFFWRSERFGQASYKALQLFRDDPHSIRSVRDGKGDGVMLR